MSAKLVMILGLVAAATATVPTLNTEQLRWIESVQQTTVDQEVELRYYFTAFKALLEGFERGLFNDPTYKINDKCMDSNTLQLVLDLEKAIASKDATAFFGSASAVFQIGYILDKSCDLNELFYILTQYCYQT